MHFSMVMAADEASWPGAAIAIAGIALVTSVVVVALWQAMSTWRARIDGSRERAYRELAEQFGRELHEIHERLGNAPDRRADGGER